MPYIENLDHPAQMTTYEHILCVWEGLTEDYFEIYNDFYYTLIAPLND